VVGRSEARSVNDGVLGGALVAVPLATDWVDAGAEEAMATMPGSRRRSSWKCTRAATRSLENSRGAWVPASMGAVKRGQRAVQASQIEGRVREAARAKASWTAAVKRAQRSVVSWAVALGSGGGGEAVSMATNSALL